MARTLSSQEVGEGRLATTGQGQRDIPRRGAFSADRGLNHRTYLFCLSSLETPKINSHPISP